MLGIGLEYLLLGPGLADLYGTFGCTVGKLVGQYSDSNRVSQSLQAPSRESKKLKPVKRRRGRGRIYQQAFFRGEERFSI